MSWTYDEENEEIVSSASGLEYRIPATEHHIEEMERVVEKARAAKAAEAD